MWGDASICVTLLQRIKTGLLYNRGVDHLTQHLLQLHLGLLDAPHGLIAEQLEDEIEQLVLRHTRHMRHALESAFGWFWFDFLREDDER